MKNALKSLIIVGALGLGAQTQAQSLDGIPVLGDLLGGGLTLGSLSLGDTNPLALGGLLESDMFSQLIVGNLLTSSLAGDLVPVSTVFLYDPLSLPDYFLGGGTILAPVVALLPPVPLLSAPLPLGL